MKNINLNEIKSVKELLNNFTDITLNGHKLTKDNLDKLDELREEYSIYITYLYDNDKLNEYDNFNFDFENYPIDDYIIEYFNKYKEELKELNIIRCQHWLEDPETSEEVMKYDKNNCSLIYSHLRIIFEDNLDLSNKDIADFSILENNYIKHLILKDKSIEFPIQDFLEKYKIKNKSVINYFIKQKSYIESIILPKIEISAPSILYLIKDWIDDISNEVKIDAYGNIDYIKLGNNLSIADYAERYFIKEYLDDNENNLSSVIHHHHKQIYNDIKKVYKDNDLKSDFKEKYNEKNFSIYNKENKEYIKYNEYFPRNINLDYINTIEKKNIEHYQNKDITF